ncbi:MAG: septum formation initiator family protein [Bacteroidales bacterium]|jgi:cell division protein FtsB|nr:septum formation initiator family protein [Bacteroidales bacterium]
MTFRKVLKKLTNRYVIATVVFVLVIVFFDQFNLKKQVELHRELKEQEAEIQHLETNIALYKDSLRMVTEDPEGMEQIAREKYFMKRDNEVVYKIADQE